MNSLFVCAQCLSIIHNTDVMFPIRDVSIFINIMLGKLYFYIKFMVGNDRWTTAVFSIDECALVKGLKSDTSYRFRVAAINKFGISPYSWASVEIRTKSKGIVSNYTVHNGRMYHNDAFIFFLILVFNFNNKLGILLISIRKHIFYRKFHVIFRLCSCGYRPRDKEDPSSFSPGHQTTLS